EFFYVNWGDYYQLLEENPALSPVEAMVTASEMQSENALPSVAQKIVNNKINISWLLSMVAGMPEQFPSTNEFSIIYKSFNKNDIGVINNINEVCYSKIADYSNSVKMNIYPNPATENVTIIVNSKDNAQAEMNITNMMGQVVYNQSIALSNGVNQFNVNVNSFSNGIYLVNIKTKNGVTAQKLIVR
ncbi:MAG: T9SS type A sorting domain-containing protein, partial [Bacteroidales bacterium]